MPLAADLAVLSACRSGRGALSAGEGVAGLARAFLRAGCRGVVCSHWAVEDERTSRLMLGFYDGLLAGRSAAAALRDARLAMLRDDLPPNFWGPFVLPGE